MGRIFALCFAGGIGGLVGWAVAEPFAPRDASSMDWSRWEVFFSLVTGAGIGGLIGAFGGYSQGSKTHFYRGIFGGIILGSIGGYLGLQLGGVLAMGLFGPEPFGISSSFATKIMARTLVFVPFGALLGLIQGLPARSLKRAMTGAIGGAIGGALGGGLFDIIGNITAPAILAARGEFAGEIGTFARGISMTIVGSAIGLFVGVVENIAKRAWIRLELGRNEGKEWIVDANQTFIGRSESAHIPLFGDPNISPMHACIYRKGGSYMLAESGASIGVGVNGIRVATAVLSHGDIINVGSFNLRFLTKNNSAVAVSSHPQPTLPPNNPLVGQSATKAPELIAISGPISGQRFVLRPPSMEVGRESNQVSIANDPQVSRKHAKFLVSDAGVIVQDLGSTNGTTVNGVKIQEMSLRPGDIIGVGSTMFRLE